MTSRGQEIRMKNAPETWGFVAGVMLTGVAVVAIALGY
jgi:hypothetical protein